MSDLPREPVAEAPDGEDDLGTIDEGLDQIDADGNPIEPEPGPEPDFEAEPEPEPQPRPTRQDRRDARVRTERDELARRLLAAETQLQQLQQRPVQPPPDPGAAAREEAAFVESLQQMLPHEAALAVARRQEGRFQQQLHAVALQSFDRTDQAEFNALRATNRTAARLAPQVEQMLQQRRQMGDYTLGRRQIFAYMLGEEVLNRVAAAPRGGAQPRLTARAAAQVVRPAAGRGDVAARTGSGRAARDQDAADEALLRGITVSEI